MERYPTSGYESEYSDYPEYHPIQASNRNLIALSEFYYDAEDVEDRMFGRALANTSKLLKEYRKASMDPEIYGVKKFYEVEDKLRASYGVLLAYLDAIMTRDEIWMEHLDKAVEPVLKRRRIKLSDPPVEESDSQQDL